MNEPKNPKRELGMRIHRRDLIHGAGLLGFGLSLPRSQKAAAEPIEASYPPTRTQLRGSHPGSFEAAHAYTRDQLPPPKPRRLPEIFDLVVVGAGISGLAAAYYYQRQFGPDKKILILDNHDDFGGHAKRNEFHQGGRMHLGIGGTHNLEYWQFNPVVTDLMNDLGVDIKTLRAQSTFDYGRTGKSPYALWFDAETFGRDQLITGCSLKGPPSTSPLLFLDQFPISDTAKAQLKRFYTLQQDLLADLAPEARTHYLRTTGYFDFLRDLGGLGAEARQLFSKSCHGSWGLEAHCLSVAEALGDGLPGLNLIGETPSESGWDYPAAFFPDGNASIARLLVSRLIPAVAKDVTATSIATQAFDYGALDQAAQSVRIRLSSTVVRVNQSGGLVGVRYLKGGQAFEAKARHTVMACYHSILPYICPDLPAEQKAAQAYQVKYPLVLTNVLIRSKKPFDQLGIHGVSCPGRMHASLFLMNGINTGGYEHALNDPGAAVVAFWGSLSPPASALDLRAQLRASREQMLALPFEAYESEVRLVLGGLLGDAGFNVDRDILAITVNRWPHGYAHEYLDLWDEDFAPGQAPHELARARFGNLTFANSDAGASAYTHTAIEEAFRAVNELRDLRS
ncbi:MAG: FAD-dependent oxidoreductase [Proteobacteria bacterium]|nr:FAD-dependent oxidoreductase [Pseudomonadota bacterium]